MPAFKALPYAAFDSWEHARLCRFLGDMRTLLLATLAIVSNHKGTKLLKQIDGARAALSAWQQKHAAIKLQVAWRHCVTDPSCLVCRRRLLSQHYDMAADGV
jgi:hypothetical protein